MIVWRNLPSRNSWPMHHMSPFRKATKESTLASHNNEPRPVHMVQTWGGIYIYILPISNPFLLYDQATLIDEAQGYKIQTIL